MQRLGLWKTAGELRLEPSFEIPLLASEAKSLELSFTSVLTNRSQEVFQRQYDTNVFGTIKMTRSILPIFRRRRAGIIIMMSSAGGNVGMPGASPYVSSKFALEGTRKFLRRN